MEAPILERVTDDVVQQTDTSTQTATQQVEAPPSATPPAEAQQQATEGQQQAEPTPPAPTPPPVPDDVSLPSPESRLAPLFELTSLPPEQAIPRAIEIMQGFYAYDQVAYRTIANAVLQASPQSATALVLQANGIPAEKVTQFSEWLASGGDTLPGAVEYPAFEETVKKLDSLDGQELVKMPDGLELDLTDPRDKAHYDIMKRLYDADVAEKKAAGQRVAEQQRAERQAEEGRMQAAQQALSERAQYYEAGRYELVDSIINPIVSNLAEGDKLFGEMLKAHARTLIDTNPEITKIGQQASAYVQQGHGFEKGTDGKYAMSGRVAEFAAAQDRIIRRELNTLVDQFNKNILRLNRAELAATSTAPVIPTEATRQVTSAAIQPPSLQNANTIEEIRAAAREADLQMAAMRRQ